MSDPAPMTCYVMYDASGTIRNSQYRHAGDPPAAIKDFTVLDVGMMSPPPTSKTHVIDLTGVPTLEAKDAGTIAAEEANEIREAVRLEIAALRVARAEFVAAQWNTAVLDAKLQALEAYEATLGS